MDTARLAIILIMGFMAYGVRVMPQILFSGQRFPEAWDRLLRYLSYALICSIIAVTLFSSGARLDADAAPYRAVALIVTVVIARKSKSAVTGMLVGAVLVSLFSWLR